MVRAYRDGWCHAVFSAANVLERGVLMVCLLVQCRSKCWYNIMRMSWPNGSWEPFLTCICLSAVFSNIWKTLAIWGTPHVHVRGIFDLCFARYRAGMYVFSQPDGPSLYSCAENEALAEYPRRNASWIHGMYAWWCMEYAACMYDCKGRNACMCFWLVNLKHRTKRVHARSHVHHLVNFVNQQQGRCVTR